MSIRLQAGVGPATGGRSPIIALVACGSIGLVLGSLALWSLLSTSAPAHTPPSPGTEKLINRAAARRAEAEAETKRLRQVDLGDNYEIDAEGNPVSATADVSDIPQNRTLAQAEQRRQAVEDIGSGVRHSDVGQEDFHGGGGGVASPSPPPTEDRSLLTQSMLGYSTVRGASWAARRPEPTSPKQSASASGENKEKSTEDRMLNIMEDALRNERNTTGIAATASTTAAQGPSRSGDGLYPAARSPQELARGGVGDMRIGGGVGPDVIVRQGKFLDCALVNRLRVDLVESPVIAMVSRDFVSLDGKYVLIPAGSKLFGAAGTVQNVQQVRVYIKFDRVIYPDQRSAYFPVRQVGAVDGEGAVGVPGDVDRHLMLQFGAAIMLGTLDGLAAAVERPDLTAAPGVRDLVMARTSANFSTVVASILQRYANVVPTISVEPGNTMKVFFSEDVLVSPYMRTSDLSFIRRGER